MHSTITKAVEKAYHEQFYAGDEPLPPVTVDDVDANLLQPSYVGRGDHYSENRWVFYRLIRERATWQNKHVLDYACGFGHWSIYYALTGARQVSGFDLSEEAIRRGSERVASQGLSDRVMLTQMDASRLTFPDQMFDIVIGVGVLHHTIKYPGIFEHLHRVMKPGAQAFFLEGLADNPLFRLWWMWKGEVPQGDVPIFAEEIRQKACQFSQVEIVGDTLLHAGKHFLWRPAPGRLRRMALRTTHRADLALLNAVPWLRRWGSFSYIILTR
jgi:SAM-dependent methyltransferase